MSNQAQTILREWLISVAITTLALAGLAFAWLCAMPDYTPAYDAQWAAHCPVLTHLYDTENPTQGDSGVVCRSLLR